ncbi:MAG: ribosome silencing factor, partial [Dehalococcoidales bacterium]
RRYRRLREAPHLEGIEVARKAVEAASERLASDVVLLDVSEICSFASYFVICSGDSDRQVGAIQDEIESALKQADLKPNHREGTLDSGWILLDFGDVIVHIFSSAEREFYQFDELWSQAVLVVRIQ